MKTTFTLEAIAAMDPTRLGELIRQRVGIGVRTFEVVTLDEAIGRLAAMGVPIVGDVDAITVPALEVESRYPAPTPDEVEALCAAIAGTGYASDATEVVEAWLEDRYGVVSTYRAKVRAEAVLHNIDPVDYRGATSLALKAIEEGRARLDTSMVETDVGAGPLAVQLRERDLEARAGEVVDPLDRAHGEL